ncbi:hypothetical protein K1719_002726 [Acacia pycnantha]|nr:hypothetical protein K1719_002726 [Acacia pycnantha]
MSFGWINVKDVANAHIQAFGVPSANRRYCLVERVAQCSDVVKILHELYPQLQLPENSSSTLALTGSKDGSVHVVNISTGRVRATLASFMIVKTFWLFVE